MEAPARPPLRPPGAAWIAFGAACAAQAAVAAAFPLVADEAYYLTWSRSPALGYLDHPPGVAAWIGLGGGHPRLPGLVGVPLAWLLLADAARRWGVRRWRWLPALVAWTPLGMGAALIATPDTPLLVAWCGVLWAVAAGRPTLAGLLFGVGLWAKSTALVALPGLLWVLGRRAPRAVVAAALIYAPHVAWSLTHDGLPWTFQARRTFGGFHLPEALGGQMLVVTPGLFLLAVSAWRRPRDDVDRALRALGLPVLVAWLAAACVTRVEANWPALAWPAAAILVLRREPPRLRAAAGLAAALTLAAAAFLALGARHVPPGVGPPRDGPGIRACLAAASPLPPVAARYQEKALLDLAGPAVPYLRAAGHRPSQYDLDGAPRPPPCGFLYLAGPRALAGRCAGTVAPGRACGRPVTACRCQGRGGGTANGTGVMLPPKHPGEPEGTPP